VYDDALSDEGLEWENVCRMAVGLVRTCAAGGAYARIISEMDGATDLTDCDDRGRRGYEAGLDGGIDELVSTSRVLGGVKGCNDEGGGFGEGIERE
jgi:hypothetical protein